MSNTRSKAIPRISARRAWIAFAALMFAAAALHYAPAADARGPGGRGASGGHWGGGGYRGGYNGGYRGGYWGPSVLFGGLVIGSAIANSYYYGNQGYYGPAYATPPNYYAQGAYAAPPVVVESYGSGAAAPYYQGSPAAPSYAPPAPQQQLPLEQRMSRLDEMCRAGVFTPQECAGRRTELLERM